MLVVCDTSPLNYLILIGSDHVLSALFGRVMTPPSVLAELSHPQAPGIVAKWASAPPPWLEVIAPSAIRQGLNLGVGETEAISLALEVRADLVLIDERAGSEVAQSLALNSTGTLGVLELAARRRLLDLSAAIDRLRQTTFRCDPRIYARVLQRNRDLDG